MGCRLCSGAFDERTNDGPARSPVWRVGMVGDRMYTRLVNPRSSSVPKDDRKWLAWALLALVIAVALPVAVLQAFGIPLTGDTSDKRFVAVLTLAGVTVTACASLIGILVSRQSERRLEHQHSNEQARLRLDAAMRAGTLFNAEDGAPDPAAVASGLLALTQLDRADLAVARLVDLWDCKHDAGPSPAVGASAGRVSHETAILVLDAALRSGRPNAELVAAELLCRNSFRLDICQSLHWPSSIDGTWNQRFGPKTKLLLVDALVQMALESKPRNAALQSLAVRLYGISAGDDNRHVKGCIGRLLTPILPHLKDVGTVMQGSSELTLEDLRDAATYAKENPDRLLNEIAKDRAAKLEKWAGECQHTDYERGALAAPCVSLPADFAAANR
jgi:hypothetical protein